MESVRRISMNNVKDLIIQVEQLNDKYKKTESKSTTREKENAEMKSITEVDNYMLLIIILY